MAEGGEDRKWGLAGQRTDLFGWNGLYRYSWKEYSILQSNERFPPNFYLGQLTLTPGHPPAHQNGGGELPETPKTGNCSEERKSSTTKFGEERKSE